MTKALKLMTLGFKFYNSEESYKILLYNNNILLIDISSITLNIVHLIFYKY